MLQKPPFLQYEVTYNLPLCIRFEQTHTAEFMSLTGLFDAFCCFCHSPLLAEVWCHFVSLFVILCVSLSSLSGFCLSHIYSLLYSLSLDFFLCENTVSLSKIYWKVGRGLDNCICMYQEYSNTNCRSPFAKVPPCHRLGRGWIKRDIVRVWKLQNC